MPMRPGIAMRLAIAAAVITLAVPDPGNCHF
jgi:hypothetical protein